ncbi:MAG: hypothetical protein V4635_17570 [Bacteroidota bacterium]
MRTTQIAFKISLLFFVILFSFSACKKRRAFNEEDGQASIDYWCVQSENDAVVSDVNDLLSGNRSLRELGDSPSSIKGATGTLCDFSLDTALLGTGTVKLNYNSITCGNRTRTGSIKVKVVDYPAHEWWQQQCKLEVIYLAYKITRVSDGKSIELNGRQIITNETGGTWQDLLIDEKNVLSTSVDANLNATFEDGKMASYNIERSYSYTFPGDIITCKAEGNRSHGVEGLDTEGLTRDGDEFFSRVTTPIVWNLTCGAWAPVAGEVMIEVADKSFQLKCLFGVDEGGNSIGAGPNDCSYGWKVEWQYKKKTKKIIIPYG